ncbi:UNVERIFIED_CONTAM: hypothetical protein NCL1_10619 [Trichonephila clavipes]
MYSEFSRFTKDQCVAIRITLSGFVNPHVGMDVESRVPEEVSSSLLHTRITFFIIRINKNERIYDVHRAVMRDQLEHVVILLENKKLALARDQLGATPLHKAVWFGHYKIAHFISQQFPETLNAIDLSEDAEGRTGICETLHKREITQPITHSEIAFECFFVRRS